MSRKRHDVADLFCGAGGTSTGALKAARELGLDINLVAVNHWEVAIATHSKNHPKVAHYNSDLKDIDPRKVVPSGKLRLLLASPECTHFSNARGGAPMSKQSRAMSFPKSYKFKGTREQIVKQIGNAVPVELAYSLCKHLLNT